MPKHNNKARVDQWPKNPGPQGAGSKNLRRGQRSDTAASKQQAAAQQPGQREREERTDATPTETTSQRGNATTQRSPAAPKSRSSERTNAAAPSARANQHSGQRSATSGGREEEAAASRRRAEGDGSEWSNMQERSETILFHMQNCAYSQGSQMYKASWHEPQREALKPVGVTVSH